MIDSYGFRMGVAIILVNNKNQVFWARRIGENNWQFPQGGMMLDELPDQCLYRELYEEIGLRKKDVSLLARSSSWIHYRLPKPMVRYYSKPLCIGQKQKWYLLRLNSCDEKIRFDITNSPEFDSFRWVSYWYPLRYIIKFKYYAYQRALQEFAPMLFRAGE